MSDFGSGDLDRGPRSDRPRINFKKLQELKDSGDEADIKKLKAQIHIFFKQNSRSTNELLTTCPREVLAIYSDKYRKPIWDENEKSITITGQDKALVKEVLDWVKASAASGDPKTESLAEYDESDPDVFMKYAKLILTAAYLGIPARDFADVIIKKTLFKLAREKLIAWEVVDFYIENFSGDDETDKMMLEVLANSIGTAWWKQQLRVNEEDEDEDDYCILSVIRAEHSQFDEELHNWCAKKEEGIRKRWVKKDTEKANAGSGDVDGGGWDNGKAAVPVGGGWDTAAITSSGCDSAPPAASRGRDSAPATGGDGWNVGGDVCNKDAQKENMAPGDESGIDTGAMPSEAALGGDEYANDNGGGSWADQVNTTPQPIASDGW